MLKLGDTLRTARVKHPRDFRAAHMTSRVKSGSQDAILNLSRKVRGLSTVLSGRILQRRCVDLPLSLATFSEKIDLQPQRSGDDLRTGPGRYPICEAGSVSESGCSKILEDWLNARGLN